jgi:outer membrane protein assembly factor BamB
MMSFRNFALSFGILALTGASSAAPSGAPATLATTEVDWPHVRFDNNHTGYQPFETTLGKANIASASEAWEDQLGAPVYGSSPAVVGGVAYIGSSDGVLWAYSAGGCGGQLCTTPLWQSTSLAQIIDGPTVANGIVYVGSQTDIDSNDGKLNAFDAAGCNNAVCAPLWQGDAGPESILDSSPTVWNGLVFVATYGGTLYAFNANGCGKALCEPVWTAQTGGPIESTPTVHKGVLFIGSNDGKLYAFKAKGCRNSPCKPIWTGDLGDSIFRSTPAVWKGRVYISSQHVLAAFDANGCGQATCAPLWQAVDNQNFFDGSPAVAYGRVYVPWEGTIAVYDAKGCGHQICDRLWYLFASGAQAAIGSAPAIANGVVYAGRNTAELIAWSAGVCHNAWCGELWKGMTKDQVVDSSPTVVNGKIYVGSADKSYPENISGRLFVYALPSLKALHRPHADRE